MQAGQERRRPCRASGRRRPILFGIECLDLVLTLANHLERDGLDASRREALLDLVPEQRRQAEAHEPVENAPRLLGVDLAQVDLAWILERLQDRLFGDFVERHPPNRLGRLLQDLGDVPGDGFALAVRVGGEIDDVGLGGGVAKLLHDVLLGRQRHIVRFVVGADSEILLGEVPNMADRGFDRVVATQELLQGLGLRGALDDDEVLGHGQ